MNWSVLAVDQSMTASGWAHLGQGDRRPTWGLKTFPSWGDDEGRYLWEWLEFLGNKLQDLRVTHLYLENTFDPHDHHEGLTNRIAQFGMIGIASTAAYLCHHPVEFAVVTPQQWRSPFIGSDRAPNGLPKHQRRKWLKDKAKASCAIRGWLIDDDNIADAIGILMFGCGAIDPGFATTQGPLFRRAGSAFDNEVRELR